MAIKWLGDNRWQIDYRPAGRNGKRVRAVFIGTRAQAEEHEAYLRGRRPKPKPKGEELVCNLFSEFLDYLELHKSSQYHYDVKLSYDNFLGPFFGGKKLADLSQKLIDEYKRKRPNRKGRAGGVVAINKELRYLGTFYRWAVKRGHATPLQFEIEKLPYRTPAQRVANIGDIGRLMDEIEDPCKRAMVLFMFWCGLRWVEVSHIRWEDIDFKSGIVYLNRTKGDRPDTCLLPDVVREVIEPFKKEAGWVFENPKTGLPWKSIKTQLKAASRRAGIKPHVTPHQLRRSGATALLEATGDLRLVQEFLRHRDITTTQLYTRISKSRLKEGMRAMGVHVDTLGGLKHTEK